MKVKKSKGLTKKQEMWLRAYPGDMYRCEFKKFSPRLVKKEFRSEYLCSCHVCGDAFRTGEEILRVVELELATGCCTVGCLEVRYICMKHALGFLERARKVLLNELNLKDMKEKKYLEDVEEVIKNLKEEKSCKK